MRNLKLGKWMLLMMAVAWCLASWGCVSAPEQQAGATPGSSPTRKVKKAGETVRIGFSMDTLKEERWQRDKILFEKRAKELGAEVSVQVADSNDQAQVQQAENLLTKGVDVLVVIPHNAEISRSIVEAAHRQGVPVISYDRLIKNCDVDLYVSHQIPKIGEMQARYLFERAPKGNYVLIGGASTDNNAVLLNEGHHRILDPAVTRGDIKIVAEQYSKEWSANEAMKNTENALTQNNNNVVAVVASNDGTAGGVVQALKAQGLTGKVLVSGQDADLAAMQRIVAGEQTMTIYKPIEPLAYGAVEAAIKLARGEKPETNATINNGKIEVPSMLYEPISVDKNNLMETVVKDGYWTMEQVFANVPRNQWPAAPTAAATSGPGANATTGTHATTNTTTTGASPPASGY